LAQGLGIIDHLLPMDTLGPRWPSWSPVLLDLLQGGRTPGDARGLRGREQAVVVPPEPLPSLSPLRLLSLKS
jgi:hypothetical protein